MKQSVAFVAVMTFAVAVGAAAQSKAPEKQATGAGSADQVIASWKATPQEVAKKTIAKYGQPQEVTANRLIWHDNGPWKYTELVNEEVAHDFPVPHKDMLYQAISYKIDADKADELLAYDGSVVLERTKGELAARCDKEEANFLAINLAHDVASGRRSVDDARAFYAQTMMAMMKENKKHEYLQGFQFQVAKTGQGDPDKPAAMSKDKK